MIWCDCAVPVGAEVCIEFNAFGIYSANCISKLAQLSLKIMHFIRKLGATHLREPNWIVTIEWKQKKLQLAPPCVLVGAVVNQFYCVENHNILTHMQFHCRNVHGTANILNNWLRMFDCVHCAICLSFVCIYALFNSPVFPSACSSALRFISFHYDCSMCRAINESMHKYVYFKLHINTNMHASFSI